jgi:excisionase family DNA binding protein
MLACGMTRVYELLKNKELEAIKDGKNRLISVASINAYLERRKAGSE